MIDMDKLGALVEGGMAIILPNDDNCDKTGATSSYIAQWITDTHPAIYSMFNVADRYCVMLFDSKASCVLFKLAHVNVLLAYVKFDRLKEVYDAWLTDINLKIDGHLSVMNMKTIQDFDDTTAAIIIAKIRAGQNPLDQITSVLGCSMANAYAICHTIRTRDA